MFSPASTFLYVTVLFIASYSAFASACIAAKASAVSSKPSGILSTIVPLANEFIIVDNSLYIDFIFVDASLSSFVIP